MMTMTNSCLTSPSMVPIKGIGKQAIVKDNMSKGEVKIGLK